MSSGVLTTQPPSGSEDRRSPGRPRTSILVAGAVALALLLVWIVAFSPLLGARTITVRGVVSLSPATVRSAASVDHGAALIRLDTGAVRDRVEALPQVASASVTVSYPSTVVITVIERVAVAYTDTGVVGANDRYEVIDRTGFQFAAQATQPATLPRIEVPAGSSSEAASDAAGRAATSVAGALPPAVLAQLTAVRANSATSVTLLLRDGRTVTWGPPTQNEQKAAVVTALLKQPGSTYDVSTPGLAVVR